MTNMSYELQLKNYVITDLNYHFDEDISSSIAHKLSEHGDLSIDQFESQIEDQNSIKVLINKSLEEVIVIMDTRIKEEIDFEELLHEKFILKALDVTIRFSFLLKCEQMPSPEILEEDEFAQNLMKLLESSILDICRHTMVTTVRNITTLDYNYPLNIDFPMKVVQDIQVKTIGCSFQ